ncbi:MAG: quinolinate synthase NadA [Chitinophagales bacterium]|nr:quinolinate synthase NadA [Chitinophagales bacterium]
MEMNHLDELGYLDIPVDPTLDLFEEIKKLKKEKNAILLAHYYQDADIQDVADYIGDSLGLAQKAESTDADMIVFAGVHFMAEVAKILNPSKKVIIPDLKAGCSLADACLPIDFAAFKSKYPNHVVISYINCSAEIKALSDYICTSSSAEHIVNSIPAEQGIIFAPDRNLGAYLIKKLGRDMVLWDGSCIVHEIFSLDKILKLKEENPESKIIAHPECEAQVLEHADYIGSTTALLKYTIENDAQSFIVATETGILHKMQENSPHKTFIPAPPNNACACNDCPFMKLNTLEKIYNAMKYEQPEIILDEELRLKAKLPIDRMLEISLKAGIK